METECPPDGQFGARPLGDWCFFSLPEEDRSALQDPSVLELVIRAPSTDLDLALPDEPVHAGEIGLILRDHQKELALPEEFARSTIQEDFQVSCVLFEFFPLLG